MGSSRRSSSMSLDPYKAQRALARLDQTLTRALVEARADEIRTRAVYEASHGDLELLQDTRTAEGFLGGLEEARSLYRAAVEKAQGSCRWCGGPDDHGQDCRPAPHGTLRRIP
jgi:hypothetical protein